MDKKLLLNQKREFEKAKKELIVFLNKNKPKTFFRRLFYSETKLNGWEEELARNMFIKGIGVGLSHSLKIQINSKDLLREDNNL